MTELNKPYFMDIFIGIVVVSLVLTFILLLFSGISYVTCLSMEGTPYWNKIVVVCHFNDTLTSISQQIITTTQDFSCFRNGVKINCSEIGGYP